MDVLRAFRIGLAIIFLLYNLFGNFSTIYAKTIYGGMDLPESDIVSPSIILMDAESGIVLYGRSEAEVNYPASITKIMTALLTLEHVKESGGSIYERVKFSRNAVFSIERGSSHIAMNEDETLTIEEALYGLLLASANEVANALAEHIGGTTEEFARMMTRRAQELGTKNTNFTNANGLHDKNHYSSAYDMALIMREAVKHPEFVEIISTKRYDIPPTEKQSKPRVLNNTNRMILPGQYFYENAVGGKTGFTNEAMHTLVSFAKVGTVGLIAVSMHSVKNAPYTDSVKLFEYGFGKYGYREVLGKRDFSADVNVYAYEQSEKNIFSTVEVVLQSGLSLFLPDIVTKDSISIEPYLPMEIQGPLEEGEIIGNVVLKYGEAALAKVNLVAAADVSLPSPQNSDGGKSGFGSIIVKLITGAGICIAVLIALLAVWVIRTRRRRRRYQRRLNKHKMYS